MASASDVSLQAGPRVRVRGKFWLREPLGNRARKKVLYLARWRQRRQNFPRTLKSEPARRQIGRTPLSIVDNLLALAKYQWRPLAMKIVFLLIYKCSWITCSVLELMYLCIRVMIFCSSCTFWAYIYIYSNWSSRDSVPIPVNYISNSCTSFLLWKKRLFQETKHFSTLIRLRILTLISLDREIFDALMTNADTDLLPLFFPFSFSAVFRSSWCSCHCWSFYVLRCEVHSALLFRVPYSTVCSGGNRSDLLFHPG